MFYGNLVIYPLFLVPVLYGKRFSWLLDWCGPIQFFAKMTITTVHFVYLDKTSDLEPLDQSAEDRHLLEKMLLVSHIMLNFLFNDCFVTTEKFYSRIANFVAYFTTLAYM